MRQRLSVFFTFNSGGFIMFKKYSCGCVVLEIGTFFIMIDPCDKDEWNNHSVNFNVMDNQSRIDDLKTKEWKELHRVEQSLYLRKIMENFYNGYKFQEIKFLLGVPNE